MFLRNYRRTCDQLYISSKRHKHGSQISPNDSNPIFHSSIGNEQHTCSISSRHGDRACIALTACADLYHMYLVLVCRSELAGHD